MTTRWTGCAISAGVAALARDLPENRGFAGGMNAGFEAATGEILIALNNDTTADPGWLAALDAAFADPDLGFAASQLMDMKDPEIIDSLGDGFLPVGLAFKAGAGLRMPDGLGGLPVQSACGAASAHRAALLNDVGRFDEAFFAYLEDIDLSLRALAAGYRGGVVPGAVVHHAGSATSGGAASDFSMRLTVRNAYRVILKNVPLPLLPVYLGLTFAFQAAVLAASFIPGTLVFVARTRGAALEGLRAALKGVPEDWRARRAHGMRRLGTGAFLARTWDTVRLHRAIRRQQASSASSASGVSMSRR